MGYPVGAPTVVQTTVVTGHKANAADEYHGCCHEAMVDVGETEASIILILNIFTGSLGTLIASCMDRRGCNCTTFWPVQPKLTHHTSLHHHLIKATLSHSQIFIL